MKRYLIIGSFIALVFLLLPGPRDVMCSGDPWYRDLAGHWAQPYIRTLWEEGVTDGRITPGSQNHAYYDPESETTRAQLATLLCKVFTLPPCYPDSPSYPDVPKSYLLFRDKPGWPWIEGALCGGIMFVPWGLRFYPDSSISRQDAVELLIRSLDLTGYAASLTDQEVDDILDPFHDHHSVSMERRHSMACAVKTGIIKGYENHTIRPLAYMARGEAAAVVARACLIRMTARKDSFSPDGDGVDDSLTFDLAYLKNRGISVWQAAIQDSSGRAVCLFNPDESGGIPPLALVWAGADSAGKPVPDGQYFYQAWVKDHDDRQFFSVRKSVTVERHTLCAWLTPTMCRDGSALEITAVTKPGANSVVATLADGRTRAFTPADHSTRWTLALVMGSFLPLGPQEVGVAASFGDAVRQVHLSFTRVEDIWLSPSVSPNPAAWGQRVDLLCDAPEFIESAGASLFGSQASLSRVSDTQWQGAAVVPWGVSPGFYPVVFTVMTATSAAQDIVSLEVKSPDFTGLTYFLSK